ncbi:hypothetical protein D3C76_1628990 [compost metagenome]
MAVIRPFEFQNLVAACIAARQSDRTHGRFRPGINHPDNINRRYTLGNQLGHLRLQQRRSAKAGTFD